MIMMKKSKFVLEDICAILISLKIVVVFNITSADVKKKSAGVVLKTTTILKKHDILKWTDFNHGRTGCRAPPKQICSISFAVWKFLFAFQNHLDFSQITFRWFWQLLSSHSNSLFKANIRQFWFPIKLSGWLRCQAVKLKCTAVFFHNQTPS